MLIHIIIQTDTKEPCTELSTLSGFNELLTSIKGIKNTDKHQWKVSFGSDYAASKGKFNILFNEEANQIKFKQLEGDIFILCGNWISTNVVGKAKINTVTYLEGRRYIAAGDISKGINKALLLAVSVAEGQILERPIIEWELVTTVGRLKEIISMRNITNIASFDYETTSFDYFKKEDKATVLSITYFPGYSYVIPFEHVEFTWSTEEFSEVIDQINILTNDYKVTKVAQNIKFDQSWASKYNITFRGRVADTQMMGHRLDEDRPQGLKPLTGIYFPFWANYAVAVDFMGPIYQLSEYCAMDSDITLRLFYIFEHELLQEGNEKIYRMIRNLDTPLSNTLLGMETYGAKVDRPLLLSTIKKVEQILVRRDKELTEMPIVKKTLKFLNQQSIAEKIKKYEEKIKLHKAKGSTQWVETYEQRIIELRTGQNPLVTEVNFNSPTQMHALIYDVMKVPIPKKYGKDAPTTDKHMLASINTEFTQGLIRYRTVAKMLNTYYLGILNRLDDNDFLHGTFKVSGTVTGRLSSANPNMQNMPSRLSYKDEEVEWVLKSIKKVFCNLSDDYVLLQADLSQAELRLIAIYANDPDMLKVYQDGGDIHSNTAASIKQISLDDFYNLPKDEAKFARYNAKAANFGQVYGISDQGYIEYAKVTYGLDLSIEEAVSHREAIFGTYKKLKEWHMIYESKAVNNKQVETLFGFRRRFKNIGNVKPNIYSQYIREAINTPIQGTSGQLVNFILTLLKHRLPEEVRMFSTIHDSILLYIPKKILGYACEIIDITTSQAPLNEYFKIPRDFMKIPMLMDYELSTTSWGDMQEIGKLNELLMYAEKEFS